MVDLTRKKMFPIKILRNLLTQLLPLTGIVVLASSLARGQNEIEEGKLTAKTIQDSIKRESLDVLTDTEQMTTGYEYVPLDSQPRVIKEAVPEYPEVARKKKISGTVILAVLIDKQGKVKEAKVVKSSNKNVGFEEAALKAAYKKVYRPAFRNNKPIAVWLYYPVKFDLPKTSPTKK